MRTDSVFEQLGIADDADERAIKRAYARKLKTLRPDEDAEGFQRLHEAYREALRICAWRATVETTVEARAGATVSSETETGDVATDEASDEPLAADRSDAAWRLDTTIAHTPLDSSAVRSEDAARGDRDDDPLSDVDDTLDNRIDGGGIDGSGISDEADRDAWRPIAPPELPWPSAPSSFGADAAGGMRAFATQAVSMAAAASPETLSEWLQAQPELWSLTGKRTAAQAVIEALHRMQPALAAAQFDALADFFGLCDLRAEHDAQSILILRDRLVLAHALAGGDLQALAERAAQDGGSRAANLRQVRRLLAQLRRPLSWPQAVWVSLVPGLPTQLRRLALTIHSMSDGHLPAGLPPEQAEFWYDAGDGARWSWSRAAMLLARLLLYPMVATVLAWLLVREDGATMATSISIAAQRYLMLASALSLAWVWLHLTIGFADWQAVEDRHGRGWLQGLRGMAIPALLIVALCLHFAPGTEIWSWLTVPALAAGTVARVAGASYSLESLVLLLRRGWLWLAVPCAIALFGAFAGNGFVRSAIFVGLALICIGLWYGARAKD